jgi:hypothetical protein
MFAARAPFARMTWRLEVVVSVEAISKTKMDCELPCPFSVRSPEEIATEEVDL